MNLRTSKVVAKADFDYPWIGQAGMLADLHESVATLRGAIAQKMDFLDRLPYSLLRVRSADVAAHCLERYDVLSRAGAKQHRLSRMFLDPTSELRSHVEAVADGGEVSEALSRAILPYGWGLIDESAAEGEHRDLRIEAQRSHRVTHPMAASNLRMSQNRTSLNGVHTNPFLNSIFAKCWKSWRLVAAPKQHERPNKMWRVPRATRQQPFNAICAAGYRYGPHAFKDTSALACFFSESFLVKASGSDVEKVMADYVAKSLVRGGVYSLPVDDDDNREVLLTGAAPTS